MDYVDVISKKRWNVPTAVSRKGRFDIKYPSEEAVTDKRFVESLKIRRNEDRRKYSLFKKKLAACIVDGMHTIKTSTGLMK